MYFKFQLENKFLIKNNNKEGQKTSIRSKQKNLNFFKNTLKVMYFLFCCCKKIYFKLTKKITI